MLLFSGAADLPGYMYTDGLFLLVALTFLVVMLLVQSLRRLNLQNDRLTRACRPTAAKALESLTMGPFDSVVHLCSNLCADGNGKPRGGSKGARHPRRRWFLG
jgi:hypothetical protein